VERDDAFLVVEAAGDAPDAVGFFIVSVVAGLMQDIGADEQTAGEAYGEAEDVYKRNEFIFSQIAEGDLEIIFEHSGYIRS
jgi:hypothetical protein